MVETNILDKYLISSQIGRKARGVKAVPVRCYYGHPQVVEVEAFLDTGEPFPTMFWLTCPQLAKDISQLEAAGKVKDIDGLIRDNSTFRQKLYQAHEEYIDLREDSLKHITAQHKQDMAYIGGSMKTRGIGGMKQFDCTKCLHLHYAHYMVTSINPIGYIVKGLLPVNTTVEERCDNYCKKYVLCEKSLGSIDAGTNSTRLLIARFTQDGILIPEAAEITITRLGKNVDKGRCLEQDSINRTVKALKKYYEIMNKSSVSAYKAVGTSALRDATNKEEFLTKARKMANIDIEVVPGKKEASLSYKGAILGLKDAGFKDVSTNSFNLVIDIGGGSTEFAYGYGEKYEGVYSVDIGAVRISEMFIHSDPPNPKELEAAISYVDREITKAIKDIPKTKVNWVIGVGGTITTVVSILGSLETYDSTKVHGYTLKLEEITSTFKNLIELKLKDRKAIVGLPAGRADIIPAGLVILARSLTALNKNHILVSDRDILHGLLYDEDSRLTWIT